MRRAPAGRGWPGESAVSPLGIFARGLAMGAADLVPGVSGGTIAFVSGIYSRLLAALRAFDARALALLARAEWRALWLHVDAGFLLALLLGIATGVFSLARLLSWLLASYPEPLWGFFFGLILASALLLLREAPCRRRRERLLLAAGALLALALALAPRGDFVAGGAGVFLAGFIAICATMLPGVSGGFVLLLLGMYGALLDALTGFDAAFLLLLASGAVCGLLLFSRLLHWLLENHRPPTMALLTGFLFGSLAAIWPWKRVLDWAPGGGEPRAARQLPVLPLEYLVRSGSEPLVLATLCAGILGAGLAWRIGRRRGGSRNAAG